MLFKVLDIIADKRAHKMSLEDEIPVSRFFNTVPLTGKVIRHGKLRWQVIGRDNITNASLLLALK